MNINFFKTPVRWHPVAFLQLYRYVLNRHAKKKTCPVSKTEMTTKNTRSPSVPDYCYTEHLFEMHNFPFNAIYLIYLFCKTRNPFSAWLLWFSLMKISDNKSSIAKGKIHSWVQYCKLELEKCMLLGIWLEMISFGFSPCYFIGNNIFAK